ncbi:hypothetical protein HBB16_17860 [Pseudonocardia sp. MCCB 268]|nr:hypothetical protein [Pseudonocardia cytotoxica]
MARPPERAERIAGAGRRATVAWWPRQEKVEVPPARPGCERWVAELVRGAGWPGWNRLSPSTASPGRKFHPGPRAGTELAAPLLEIEDPAPAGTVGTGSWLARCGSATRWPPDDAALDVVGLGARPPGLVCAHAGGRRRAEGCGAGAPELAPSLGDLGGSPTRPPGSDGCGPGRTGCSTRRTGRRGVGPRRRSPRPGAPGSAPASCSSSSERPLSPISPATSGWRSVPRRVRRRPRSGTTLVGGSPRA